MEKGGGWDRGEGGGKMGSGGTVGGEPVGGLGHMGRVGR